MTLSVQKDKQGPDWPLGNIVVATPGTPVSIMSLVDATNVNDPGSAVGGSTISGGLVTGDEYTVRAYGIIFEACKAGASHGMQANAGLIYIVRKGIAGAGNRDDQGSIIKTLAPGNVSTSGFFSFVLLSAPLNRNTFNPYRYFIDADNAADGCQVTLLIE